MILFQNKFCSVNDNQQIMIVTMYNIHLQQIRDDLLLTADMVLGEAITDIQYLKSYI